MLTLHGISSRASLLNMLNSACSLFLFCQELTPLCACISIIVLTEQITYFKKRGHDSRTPVVSGLTQNMLYTFTLHTDHV